MSSTSRNYVVSALLPGVRSQVEEPRHHGLTTRLDCSEAESRSKVEVFLGNADNQSYSFLSLQIGE
jgi:hypothetical protein